MCATVTGAAIWWKLRRPGGK